MTEEKGKMNEENKSLFEEMKKETSKEQEETIVDEQLDVEDTDYDVEYDEEDNDIVVNVASKSKAEIKEEKGVKQNADGRILTIKEVSILPPRIHAVNPAGEKTVLPPKETKNGNKYYTTKLKVRFEEDNLVEYYPSIRIWVNEGQLQLNNVQLDSSRFDDGFVSATKVAQIVRLALHAMNGKKDFKLEKITMNEKPVICYTNDTKTKFFELSEKISDQKLLQWMVGKKVKISTSKGNYEGKNWYRNDFEEFVI